MHLFRDILILEPPEGRCMHLHISGASFRGEKENRSHLYTQVHYPNEDLNAFEVI